MGINDTLEFDHEEFYVHLGGEETCVHQFSKMEDSLPASWAMSVLAFALVVRMFQSFVVLLCENTKTALWVHNKVHLIHFCSQQ